MKRILIFITFQILISFFVKCEMTSENVVFAINCGGDSYRDARGIIYEKDSYFSGGQTSDFGANFEIKLTNDAELYQTERWSSEDLIYDIPLPNPGKYVLVLKFSEVYFNSPSEKIFDIYLGKEAIIKQLDIFSKVGKATAYDEFIEFEFKNNKIYLNNRPIDSAYNEEMGNLKLIFKKGERDNPKINAIIIVKGNLADTDYEQYKGQFEELERQKLEKERKQKEFQKKSNDYDYEDFEDDYIDTFGGSAENKSGLFSTSSFLFICLAGIIFYTFFVRSKKNIEFDSKDD